MTNYYPLVGLVGRKRSGKDTFARGLANQGFTRVAFADPLRDALLETNPIVGVHLTVHGGGASSYHSQRLSAVLAAHGGWEGVKDTKYADEVRGLLQRYGQAIRRLEPDFWLRQAMAKAQRYENAVITDVRYRNEADAVQMAGGILIRIVRPGLDTSDTHASETELDDYPIDFVVRNHYSSADQLEAYAASLEL